MPKHLIRQQKAPTAATVRACKTAEVSEPMKPHFNSNLLDSQALS